MKFYAARRLASILDNLTHCRLTSLSEHQFSDGARSECTRALLEIGAQATELGLHGTRVLATRIADEIRGLDGDAAFSRIDVLAERFWDETKELKFFHVPPERFRFYEDQYPAGTEFSERFPSANGELVEAGRCLALDRHTACAFHVMRALERVVRSLERELGIVPPSAGPENTWGRVLGRVKNKMDANDKLPSPTWADDREFFVKAHAFLRGVQVAFRDSTIHEVKANYDAESATSVFRLVTEAARNIAPRLNE